VTHLVLHTDGGSRGNPGPAAIGVVIEVERGGRTEVIREIAETIGVATNNVAEYRAVIRGLEEAKQLGADRVSCWLDSQLVVEQLNGRYRVKHADMVPLHQRVTALRAQFASVSFKHVPREQNRGADALVNAALDGKAVETLLPRVEPSPGLQVEVAPHPHWEPLDRPGCVDVDGRVLLHAAWGHLAMLRFGPHGTIAEHAADHDIDVICLEGAGFTSVAGEAAPLPEGYRAHWPAGQPHRLWTDGSPMVALMVEPA
jgi:ribonuclease HI/quercetin dioxygenase-like cupin family protein